MSAQGSFSYDVISRGGVQLESQGSNLERRSGNLERLRIASDFHLIFRSLVSWWNIFQR